MKKENRWLFVCFSDNRYINYEININVKKINSEILKKVRKEIEKETNYKNIIILNIIKLKKENLKILKKIFIMPI